MQLIKELNETTDDHMWTELTPEQTEQVVDAVKEQMEPNMTFGDVLEIVFSIMEDIPGLEIPDKRLAKQIARRAWNEY